MSTDLIPADLRELWEVHEWKHACAILAADFPAEWADLLDLLRSFRLKKSWITVGGGNRSLVSRAIDSFLYQRGWTERQFATLVRVDAVEFPSPTHKVDCFKTASRSKSSGTTRIRSSTGISIISGFCSICGRPRSAS